MKYGQNASLAIGFQSATSTNQFRMPTLQWLPLLSESVSVEQPPLVEQNMHGVFDEGNLHSGPITISGELSVEASPLAVGLLFQSVLGNSYSVRSSNNYYVHLFSPKNQDHNSKFVNHPLAIYKHFHGDSKARVFYDMVASSLELSVANGEFLKLKLGMLGGRFKDTNPVSVTYNYDKPLSWQQAKCNINNDLYGDFTQLSIQLDENLEVLHTLDGGKYPSRIQRSGFRTISLQGSARFDNDREYVAFLNQERRSFSLEFESGVTLSGDVKESVQISLPEIQYVELKPTISGPGPLETEFSAKAIRQANGNSINITLVNTHAPYTT